MKHRIIAVLVLIGMVCAVIAGSKFEMTGASEELTGLSLFERKESIYFWYADENLADFINSAAVAFGEEHNVRVIPQLVSESEYIEAINDATLHSEQMPDAYLVSNDSLEKAYLAGLAAEVIDEKGICNGDHFSRGALSAVTYHDKKVAYPFYFDTTALVYNRTYLEMWLQQQATNTGAEQEEVEIPEQTADSEGTADDGEAGDAADTGEEVQDEEALALERARIEELLHTGIPQTIDDILYIANTFAVPEGVEGIMKWAVSDILYNYWIVGNYMIVGGDTGDQKTNINISNEQTIDCLEIYKALNQYFYIGADTVTYDSAIQDLIDGKIVFTVATTDVVRRLENAEENGELSYEYGITVMPDISDTLSSRSVSVTNAVAVNGYSRNRELADQFAAFLTGEYSGNLFARTGKIASCINANPADAYIDPFQAEYADSVPFPKMIATSNLWIQMEVLFSKLWNGEDAAELLDELSEQIQMQLGIAVG